MNRLIRETPNAETIIDRRRVFEHDPALLYSETDLKRIRMWNKRVDTEEGTDISFILSYEKYWRTESRRTAKLYLSELYCALQYNLAKRKLDENIRSNTYTASQICDWFDEVTAEQTVRKYLQVLVTIGLLRKTGENRYIKATSQLGPVFEQLAAGEKPAETAFDRFPAPPDCPLVEHEQPATGVLSTLKRYVWNEHIVGWMLLTTALTWMLRLLIEVRLTGRVTPVGLVLAGTVTWLGLVGFFALGIGLTRRRRDGLRSLRQYRAP